MHDGHDVELDSGHLRKRPIELGLLGRIPANETAGKESGAVAVFFLLLPLCIVSLLDVEAVLAVTDLEISLDLSEPTLPTHSHELNS